MTATSVPAGERARGTAIPLHLRPRQVEIQADQRLVFQYLTAFGRGEAGDKGTSRVLRDEGARKLVEFHTEIRDLIGRKRTVHTVEWVTPNEPDSIDFEAISGPLAILRDRLELEEHGGCTVLRYHSTIGVRGWLFGLIVAALVIRPIAERHTHLHLLEIKEATEARARRSRVYPQQPCDREPALAQRPGSPTHAGISTAP